MEGDQEVAQQRQKNVPSPGLAERRAFVLWSDGRSWSRSGLVLVTVIVQGIVFWLVGQRTVVSRDAVSGDRSGESPA